MGVIVKQLGMLLIISGPSGTGKGTLVKQLMESDPSFGFSCSVTPVQVTPHCLLFRETVCPRNGIAQIGSMTAHPLAVESTPCHSNHYAALLQMPGCR